MHIVEVKLENIKSHADSRFDFERGTTAIVGENGAGKTTIIEAIAWALFDLLDYKKDDFVRRGQKKGSVQVTFESSKDERRYTVYRDTGTGYSIFDPEIGMKVADKKEDVSRFLLDHLGVEAGTDLELLFRTAIGVPQGTFTAVFLEAATRRKDTFDKLLKVEEYRQGAEKLRATTRYVEDQIAIVREKIARAEGELSRSDQIENEYKEAVAGLAELKLNVERLQAESTEKRAVAEAFDKEEAVIKKIQNTLDKLKAGLATSEVLLRQKQGEVDSAKQAADILNSSAADHSAHVAALAELKTLEAQRGERDKILSELKTIETAIIKFEAEQKNLHAALLRAENAKKEIADLDPLITKQTSLENKREHMRTKQARAKANKDQIGAIENRLQTLREDFKKIDAEVKEAEEKSKAAIDLDTLSRQETEITRRIASLQAKLESDERFQREIKNGLCPILSAKCMNLAEGQTLEDFVSSQFDELKTEITAAEAERVTVAASLKTAREAGQYLKALEALRRRHEEITIVGKKLRDDQASAKKKADEIAFIDTELQATENELAQLKNPRERAEALGREAGNLTELTTRIADNEKELESQTEQKSQIEKSFEKYTALDADWAKFSAERDRTAAAHRDYLANEIIAKSLPDRETALENAKQENEKLTTEAGDVEGQLAEASKNYDAEKHQSVRIELMVVERELAEANARSSIMEKRQGELEKERERLKGVLASMQTEFKEKERLEKIGEATKFIRDTLKEAAPRVARNYVYHVSNEANQLFREISGNPERTLKWSEDYAVMLEEGGYERPFQSLSGGEQMAAALSLRLALLKQLSDVRMAFFDEPTTNMDSVRRQNLAEHISHITEKDTFDQLFVISHDDTFEEYVDNVVTVGGGVETEQTAFALTS